MQKQIKRSLVSGAVLLALAGSVAPAYAATIGFEYLASPGCCTFLPDPYQGFTWSGTQPNFSW